MERYEERTGRSMSALNWYQALALWKAAVFMEGNLKRFQAGASDDEYLGLFVEGVPALAEAALADLALVKGLLVDFGGVLTTNVFDSFKAFCEKEGLDPDAVKRLFREDPRALAELRRLERGELTEEELLRAVRADARRVGHRGAGGPAVRRDGSGRADDRGVKTAKRSGVKTGLISNSWGRGRYDRDAFPEMFDGVVISGEVGLHKPEPEIFHLGAERIGVAPRSASSSTTSRRTATAPRRSG